MTSQDVTHIDFLKGSMKFFYPSKFQVNLVNLADFRKIEQGIFASTLTPPPKNGS